MVFTCLSYSSRNGARRRRDALKYPKLGGPSRCARAGAPRGDLCRSSGGCARPPPFGGASCPSSRAALLPVSTGFPAPKLSLIHI